MSKCQNKFNKSVNAAIVIHYLVHISLIFLLSPYLDNRMQKPNQFRTDYCQDCLSMKSVYTQPASQVSDLVIG